MEKQNQNSHTVKHLGANKKQRSQEIAAKSAKQENRMCQECSFQITVGLTQQILELRQKIASYQKQIHEVQRISLLDYNGIQELLRPLQSALHEQTNSETQAQKQIGLLQSQLFQLQKQLQQEQALAQNILQRRKKVQTEQQNFQQEIQNQQLQFRKVNQTVLLFLKQAQIQRTLGILERTNFISIIYSITFDNDNSYLNGEKVAFDNFWKVIEIIFFYQTKYSDYHPIYHIFWTEMKLQTQRDLRQINYADKNSNFLLKSLSINSQKQFQKQIYMDFSCQQNILQKWMPYFLLQIKNFFSFLNAQAGHNSKLKYEINNKGEFQVLKDKSFENSHQRFNRTIRCLLTDIDQINKTQFFAKQKRIKSK